jgi:hypothetical protein
MSTSDDAGGTGQDGPVGPLCTLQRATLRRSIERQRHAADSLLRQVGWTERHSRRARLSSHYAAVRGVDRVAELHPREDPSVDPLYDGVGRAFELLTDLDARANRSLTNAIETTATLSERLTRRALSPGLSLI